MESPFEKFDPRVFMALSGEFRVPSDPLERKHTAAMLYLEALTKGTFYELDDVFGETFKYYPIWAPVEVIAGNGQLASRNRILLQIANREHRLGAVVLVGEPELEAIGLGGNKMPKRNLVGYDTVERLGETTERIASHCEDYFSKFEGGIRNDDGIWLPPPPQS